MSTKRHKGVEALVKVAPVPLDQMTMIDLFAAFCMVNVVCGPDHEREAEIAYDRAEAMLKEREKRQ